MGKSKVQKIIIFCLLIMVLCIMIYTRPMSEKLRFAQNLGMGYNLGNALDSTNLRDYEPEASELSYETFWGNPKINEEQLKAIADAGFQTVRIPITWEDHMDVAGNVSDEWMRRVKEVVDMALAEELYVIIDTHHEDWLNLEADNEVKITERFEKLWLQISETFRDYDEKLLFEGMNEPRLRDSKEEWTEGTKELREMVNRLNRVFVDTVRSTGGNNEERYLLVGAYATNYLEAALQDLEVPDGNILISVHMYRPYQFCQNEEGTNEWVRTDRQDTKEIQEAFKNMNRFFIRKGIPVVVSEFGCMDKNNTESRREWVIYYKELSDKYGIPCIWWDNGSSYQLLDRERVVWTYPEIVSVLVGESSNF